MGAAAGVAHAQSSVTIYGIVDTGFVKENGSDWRMDSHVDSRIGFRGVEDLGNGLKATFELERRFNPNDGTKNDLSASSPGEDGQFDESAWNYSDAVSNLKQFSEGKTNIDWMGAANVGLKGNWDAVRFGRVNSLSVETFRMLDPFNQYGVGAALAKADFLRSEQMSNTVRYDSPIWNGFSFGATYTLGGNSKDKSFYGDYYNYFGNDGFAVNLKYDNGPILLLANVDRMVDSEKSYTWNVGGAYTWNGLKMSLGYQASKDKHGLPGGVDDDLNNLEQKSWIVGLQYQTGPHTINASYNRGRDKLEDEKFNANKYALGYTYNLSKRTSVYGNIAYTDSDLGSGMLFNMSGSDKDSVTGVQIGLTHKF